MVFIYCDLRQRIHKWEGGQSDPGQERVGLSHTGLSRPGSCNMLYLKFWPLCEGLCESYLIVAGLSKSQ